MSYFHKDLLQVNYFWWFFERYHGKMLEVMRSDLDFYSLNRFVRMKASWLSWYIYFIVVAVVFLLLPLPPSLSPTQSIITETQSSWKSHYFLIIIPNVYWLIGKWISYRYCVCLVSSLSILLFTDWQLPFTHNT